MGVWVVVSLAEGAWEFGVMECSGFASRLSWV